MTDRKGIDMLRLITLRFMESYFRHRWLYLIPIVLMTIIGVVSILIAKPKFIAQGVFYVQKESFLSQLTSVKGSNFTWQTAATMTVGEMNELLQTDAFIRAVIKDTQLEGQMDAGREAVDQAIDEVRRAVWVIPLGENQVRINAIHENPELAYQVVNGVINIYLQWKINADRTESQAAQTFFTGLIASYKADVDTARQNLYAYLEAHPGPIRGERPAIEQFEINRLQGELELAQSRFANALDKNENALLGSAQAESDVFQSYVLIDAPRLPEQPETSLRKLALQAGIFVLAGVLLSVLGIAGGAVLDRSFRFPIDVWNGLHLPVLAAVPNTIHKRSALRKRKEKASRRSGLKGSQALPEVPVAVAEASLISTSINEPDAELVKTSRTPEQQGAKTGAAATPVNKRGRPSKRFKVSPGQEANAGQSANIDTQGESKLVKQDTVPDLDKAIQVEFETQPVNTGPSK